MAAPTSVGSPRGSIPLASHSSAMTRRPRLPPPTSPSVVSYDVGRACYPCWCQRPSPPHQFSAFCESNPGSL
eukprot:3054031-Rhodomonas_salina.1